MKEHDGMVAEEIDVAVIVDNPKEHSVRFLKSGRKLELNILIPQCPVAQ